MCCYLGVFVREYQIHKPSWCAQGLLYYYTLIVLVDTCADDVNICNYFVFSILCLWFVRGWGLCAFNTKEYVLSLWYFT